MSLVVLTTVIILLLNVVSSDSNNSSSSVWGYYTVEDACTTHSKDVVTFHLGTCVIGNSASQIRCFGYMLSPVLAFTQGFSSIEVGSDPSTTGNALAPVFLNDVENQVFPVAFAKSGSTNVRHMCAVMSNNLLKCWGEGAWGSLGLGSYDSKPSDHSVEAIHRDMGDNLPYVDTGTLQVRSASVGEHFTCALLENDSVKCWGDIFDTCQGMADCPSSSVYGDHPGEVPDDSYAPIDFGGDLASDVVSGNHFACALLQNGDVRCWGDNSRGQLGLGSAGISDVDMYTETLDASHTVSLGTGRFAIKIAALSESVCALLDNNSVKCWGSNDFGSLGAGLRYGASGVEEIGLSSMEMGDNLLAVQFNTTLDVVVDLVGGGDTACAIFDSGKLACWGSNLNGQLGIDGNMIAVGDDSGHVISNVHFSNETMRIVSASVGASHVCALSDSGELACWGSNQFGELGLGLSESESRDPSNTSLVDVGCQAFRCSEPTSVQYVTELCSVGTGGNRGTDTRIENCTSPDLSSEFVKIACLPGSYSEIGTDTVLRNCTMPFQFSNSSISTWVKVGCVSGRVDSEGVDTVLSECAFPDSTQYTTSPCVMGSSMSPGTNTVISNCTRPVDTLEFVTVSCVPGTEILVGIDTEIDACEQPVNGMSFTNATCISGQVNGTGTNTGIQQCLEPNLNEYVHVACDSGNSSRLGQDSEIQNCSIPGPGIWTLEVCDPGSPAESGSNTGLQNCYEPVFDIHNDVFEHVTSLCLPGDVYNTGHDTVVQNCTRAVYSVELLTCDVADPNYVCEYVSSECIPGSWNTLGTDSEIQNCSQPDFDEIMDYDNRCNPGSPAEIGFMGITIDAGLCPPGEGMIEPATVFSQIVCAPCVNETYSPSTSSFPCFPWSTCELGRGLLENGTDYSDRTCRDCAQHEFSDVDDGSPCKPHRTCPNGTGLVIAGTAESDNVCQPCSHGTFSPDDSIDPCFDWTECGLGLGILLEGTNSEDRICEHCVNETYSDTIGDAPCLDFEVCDPGTFVTVNGTASENRQCRQCPNGRFSSVEGMQECIPWQSCGIGFGLKPGGGGTRTTDRICEPCPEGYESNEISASECTLIQTFTVVYIIVASIVTCLFCMFGYRQYRKWKYAKYIAEKKSRIAPVKKKKKRRKKKNKNKVAPAEEE